jgi:hypothetical protein
MYYAEGIKKWSVSVDSGNPDDGWKLARPITGCFLERLRDAWQVLIGNADAVRWYTSPSEKDER